MQKQKEQVLVMNQEAINKLAEMLNNTPLGGNQTLGTASAVAAHFQQVFDLLGKNIKEVQEEVEEVEAVEELTNSKK